MGLCPLDPRQGEPPWTGDSCLKEMGVWGL